MEQRRTTHFVDSAVQGALARRIVLHWLFVSLLIAGVMPLWQLMSNFKLDEPFVGQLQNQWAKTVPVLVVLVAMLPIFVLDTIRFSHRFAGPIFRFHNVVKRLAAGEQVEPIHLRKGDAWTEFANDFNAMVRHWSGTRDAETAGKAVDGGPPQAG